MARPELNGPLGRRDFLSLFGFAAAAAATRSSAEQRPAVFRFTSSHFTQGGWARGIVSPELALDLDGRRVPVAADGTFLIAFDRDAPPAARLAASAPDGRRNTLDLAIAPRGWRIEHVNAPMRPPSVPSAEYQRIRAAELARIAAARKIVTAAAGWRQAMIRPVPGRISGLFGSQRVYQGQPGSYHTGLDLAARSGTPILCPADGVVVLAADAPFTLEGRLLMVDHGMGLSSAFLHCSGHLVRTGDAVRQGQAIAAVGMTGRASGPHLHWGLRWNDARLDPLLFLPAA